MYMCPGYNVQVGKKLTSVKRPSFHRLWVSLLLLAMIEIVIPWESLKIKVKHKRDYWSFT